MASLSQADLRMARKAGFRRKKPKKPKRSASVSAMENYLARCKDYDSAARAKISEYKKKEALRKKIHKY